MSTTDYAYSKNAGNRIRKQRISLGQTQEEFALKLGISVSYLGSIERGSRPISRRVLERLHDTFGISYSYLLDGENVYPSAALNAVAETSGYHIRRDLSLLLGGCSQNEIEQCYHLIRTYLEHMRST